MVLGVVTRGDILAADTKSVGPNDLRPMTTNPVARVGIRPIAFFIQP